MNRIKRIVEDHHSPAGWRFNLFILLAIIVSILSFSVQTLPNLPPATVRLMKWIEWGTILIFTVEYILRLAVADKKLAFMTSFLGLIDLFAILPFYLSLEVDLRSVRAFRLLLLFRILKIARYNQAMQRFHLAFKIAKEELVLFLTVTVMLLYFSAAGIYYFENAAQPDKFASIFHSLWWAVETLTTVGYGDVYPVTVGGKLFTFFILLIGLGIVAIPAGLVASAISKAREIEKSERLAAQSKQNSIAAVEAPERKDQV